MKNRIYLDYNATTPLRPEARTAMNAALEQPLNASSVHAEGRAARKIVEDARAQIAALVNAPVNQVIFNSGATEGNNTVLKFFGNERILVSSIEHPSVLEAAPKAQRIPVLKNGTLDLAAFEDLLKKEKPALVSVMLVNNETGAVQPIAEISALAKKYGALVHCDAVQAAGKIPVDITALGVDFLTLSAHKLGGPQGAGALILGLCGITPTWLEGGGQEKKARAGTENVAAIAGFGAAAEAARKNLAAEQKRLQNLRDAFEKKITAIAPGVIFHAQNTSRMPNTSMFSLPGARAETLLMSFDLENISVSNGSACSSGTVKPSHVLKAMQVDDTLAAGSLRVSMGWDTKDSDIAAFLTAFEKIAARLQSKTRSSAHA